MRGSGPDLDPFPILEAIGITDAVTTSRLTVGLGGAAMFRVERPHAVQALRVYQPGGDANAEREQAAMAAAHEGGVPVPTIDARGSWLGRPLALLEWCRGTPMIEEIGRRPWRAFACGRLLGRVQARLHAAPLPDEGPFATREWVDRFGAVEPRLRARLTATPGRRALLHLDLHPLNVLVLGNRITGVIDWENATLGDHRADLARTWSILRLAPMPPAARRPGVHLVRRAIEAGWRRGYREVAGWPADLAPFQTWAVEAMIHDLSPKIGGPGVWLRTADLEPIRRAAESLRARSSLDG